jgi:EmrB/QacA subfamily drug resistance transporter
MKNDSHRLVLIVSILSSIVAFLDSSVANVALPAIVKDIGGGLAEQQWIVDAYLLTLGSCILIAGSLSDLFGRKVILTVGLVGFLLTSILCGIAPNAPVLVVARALQGIAGALLVPSSLALIISSFSEKTQGNAIGTWTAWTGVSFVIGPLLGGFLVDTVSWRGVFLINLIPIPITLWLLRMIRTTDRPQHNRHVDVAGAITCAIGLGGLVYGFIEQPQHAWSSLTVVIPLLVGTMASIVFVIVETNVAEPMVPLELFAVRNFTVGNIATVALYAGLSIATFVITVFLQEVAGFTALAAGLSLLPVTITMFLLSSRFGAWAGTYGPRAFMSVGPVLAGVGFLLLLTAHAPISYWSQFFPGIVLFGIGLSVTVAPLTAAILGDIHKEHAGVASAINNAVSRIAGLIAIALIGLVIGSDGFLSGTMATKIKAFHDTTVIMATLLILAGVISMIGIKNQKQP